MPLFIELTNIIVILGKKSENSRIDNKYIYLQRTVFGTLLITIPVQQHFKIHDQELQSLVQAVPKAHMVFLFNTSVVFVGSFHNFGTYVQAMHSPVILKSASHDLRYLKIPFIN